jgi:hypothetical protein
MSATKIWISINILFELKLWGSTRPQSEALCTRAETLQVKGTWVYCTKEGDDGLWGVEGTKRSDA